MSHKKAINNNTKGRKRCKQSAERKNKRSSAVLSLGSCFGERLKSARLMCLNKSSFLCGKKEGKKQPHFFLNFFSQLNFFSFAFKKTKEEFYSRRARYRREYTSHNNNNSLILIARSKEKIYTHTHTLRYIIRVNVGIIRVRRLGRPRQERLLLETQNPILATDATTVGPIRPVRLSQMARVGFSRAHVHVTSVFRPRVLHRDVWVRDL